MIKYNNASDLKRKIYFVLNYRQIGILVYEDIISYRLFECIINIFYVYTQNML